MPLQVNLVNLPAVMGSNTIATKQFLEELRPFQRSAIRKMELHLLASVTEAWSLRSMIRSIADVSDSVENRDFLPDHCAGEFDTGCTGRDPESSNSHGSSDLRELAIFITTRDLLLAQADSLVGLLHVLTVPPAFEASARPSTPFACTASWVTQGLGYLKSLRKLNIVIEASALIASQIPIDDRAQFAGFVQAVLPSTKVDIKWITRKDMILAPDDLESSSWVDLLWLSDTMASNVGQGWINQNQDGTGTGRKVGWSSWNSVAL